MSASPMYSSLYESTHAAVILNSGGMVVLWSRAAEQLFGWPAEDVEGRPAGFLSPANRSLFLSCLNDDRQGGINRIRCRTRSGQDRDLTVAIMPITGHAPEDTHCLGLFLNEDSDHDGLSPLIRPAGRDARGLRPIGSGSDLVPLRSAIGAAGRPTPRILFVDQAEEDAAQVITGLHNLGCLVTHCRGTHSSRMTFMASPDGWTAVVIDDPLPMMSWVELIQDIRAVCPEMPILFIHDAPGAPEPRRLEEIGKARALAKPVKPDCLAQALGALLLPA